MRNKASFVLDSQPAKKMELMIVSALKALEWQIKVKTGYVKVRKHLHFVSDITIFQFLGRIKCTIVLAAISVGNEYDSTKEKF